MNFIKFVCPFTMMISGPSGSGKTILIRRLLKYHHHLILPRKNELKILWCYGQWQKLYDETVDNVFLMYFEGLPNEEEIIKYDPDIIVIDDLMNEVCDDKKMGNLFTKQSHHLNKSVIFITQNLFHQGKQMRNIHLSCHYLILMKNTRDASQIDILGRQMKMIKELDEAYKDATRNAYGYLVIDFKQETPRDFVLKTNLIPEVINASQKIVLYQSK